MPTKKTRKVAKTAKPVKKDEEKPKVRSMVKVHWPESNSYQNYWSTLDSDSESEMDTWNQARHDNDLFSCKIAMQENDAPAWSAKHYTHFATLVVPANYICSIRGI